MMNVTPLGISCISWLYLVPPRLPYPHSTTPSAIMTGAAGKLEAGYDGIYVGTGWSHQTYLKHPAQGDKANSPHMAWVGVTFFQVHPSRMVRNVW